jgi:hypothetical protein
LIDWSGPVSEPTLRLVAVKVGAVIVPVAVTFATEIFPENKPLPWTLNEKSDDGDEVPIDAEPKYEAPVDVNDVVEA